MNDLSRVEVFHRVEELQDNLLSFCSRRVLAQKLCQSASFDIFHHEAATCHFVVFETVGVDNVGMVEGYGCVELFFQHSHIYGIGDMLGTETFQDIPLAVTLSLKETTITFRGQLLVERKLARSIEIQRIRHTGS